jgi:hypothetical protein
MLNVIDNAALGFRVNAYARQRFGNQDEVWVAIKYWVPSVIWNMDSNRHDWTLFKQTQQFNGPHV